MPSLIQPSFAKGEVGDDIFGRVDTAAYQVALRRAYNVVIRAAGGAARRPGTYFIGPVKTHTYAPRLIPFQFKTTDTHILEFGDQYIRFIRNDAYITRTATNISGITTANPAVVTSASHGISNGEDVYIEGVVGMTQVNGRWFRAANVTTNTFELTDQVTGSNINSSAYTTYSSGGTVARMYEISSPYLQAELFELNFVQSADVLTVVHKNHAPRELSRAGLTSWTLAAISFVPTTTFPTGLSVSVGTSGSVTDRYIVTAIDAATGQESLAGLNTTSRTITGITQANPGVVTATAHGFENGDEVYLDDIVGMTQLNDKRVRVANTAANTFELQDLDGNNINTTSYTAYSSGGTARQAFVRITNSATTRNNTVSWTAVSGARKYSIYREEAGIFGLIGEATGTSFVDANFNPDESEGAPQFRDPFQEADSYPSAVGYFEQRRVFGGSTDKPDTSQYSRIGGYSNFSRSSPLRDDDAIEAQLPAQRVNEVRHYMPTNDLLVFTSGSEWRVNSGQDSIFAAATIKQKQQSAWGSSFQRPILLGSTVLFVQENRARVRSFGYSLQVDGYTGTDLNLLASHIFAKHYAVDWDMARYPDAVIHTVRSDGLLAALTFQQEQEVIAWSRWETDGKFEAVAALPRASDELFDRAYFVVKRIVNGQVVRYVERLTPQYTDAVEDCFFVDCGLTLDAPMAITGVSLADPCVVTSAAHGLSNGDLVDIVDIVWAPETDAYGGTSQPDQLNGRRFKVANVATNTFELQDLSGNDIDSSAFNAYLEGGKVRKAVQTITNLHHLEGRTLVALCDGNVVEDLVPSVGVVTLPRRFSRVHIGLKYASELETLDREIPQGTTQGKTKTIGRIGIRFEKSRGLFYGPSFDPRRMVELKQRESENYDEPTNLLNDIRTVYMEPDWNTGGRVCIRQTYPLPMTILAIAPDYTFEDFERRGD